MSNLKDMWKNIRSSKSSHEALQRLAVFQKTNIPKLIQRLVMKEYNECREKMKEQI